MGITDLYREVVRLPEDADWVAFFNSIDDEGWERLIGWCGKVNPDSQTNMTKYNIKPLRKIHNAVLFLGADSGLIRSKRIRELGSISPIPSIDIDGILNTAQTTIPKSDIAYSRGARFLSKECCDDVFLAMRLGALHIENKNKELWFMAQLAVWSVEFEKLPWYLGYTLPAIHELVKYRLEQGE